MHLSLDELRELVFDFNSTYLINYYYDLTHSYDYMYLSRDNSTEFIQTILNNIHFDEILEEEEEYHSE